MRFLVIVVSLWAVLLMPKGYAYDDAPIVFIGDSITLGMLASNPSNTFVSLLLDDLERRGIEGESRMFISMGLHRDLLAAQGAVNRYREVFVVEVGVHAASSLWLPPEGFQRGYGLMLDCLVGTGATVVVGTVPWLGWQGHTTEFVRARELSEIIGEEAANRGVPVADLWAATKFRKDLLSQPDEASFRPPYHGDRFHPGDAGHALIAQLYSEALTEALANPPDRPYENRCDYEEYIDW